MNTNQICWSQRLCISIGSNVFDKPRIYSSCSPVLDRKTLREHVTGVEAKSFPIAFPLALENSRYFTTPPLVSPRTETSGGVAKCRLFSQATVSSILHFWSFFYEGLLTSLQSSEAGLRHISPLKCGYYSGKRT